MIYPAKIRLNTDLQEFCKFRFRLPMLHKVLYVNIQLPVKLIASKD